jgi:hypothetical protein
MKQIALLLATVAALATPAAAQPPQRTHLLAPHPHGKPHPRGLVPFDAWGWPVAVPVGRDIVTHDFEDPRTFPPRPFLPPRRVPRTIEILDEPPTAVRLPPHIIQVRRFKHRPPITVVRRGVISQE